MIGMSRNPKLISEKFWAMGTNISIDVVSDRNVSDKKIKEAIAAAKAVFEKYEQIFSRFRADSELARLNKNIGKRTKVSAEMLKVLELCVSQHNASEGYFEPRIIEALENIGYDKDFRSSDFNGGSLDKPLLKKIDDKLENNLRINPEDKTIFLKRRIDTTGIVKGYAVDRAAEDLQRYNLKNFIVDAGGDMYIEGHDSEKEEWRIAVEGVPENRLMLKLNHAGIATSGISRKHWRRGVKKFHHLINPKDPENFCQEFKTVTVLAEKTVDADALAKTLFLMGREKGRKFVEKNKIKVLFLDCRGNVFLSERMKENIITS